MQRRYSGYMLINQKKLKMICGEKGGALFACDGKLPPPPFSPPPFPPPYSLPSPGSPFFPMPPPPLRTTPNPSLKSVCWNGWLFGWLVRSLGRVGMAGLSVCRSSIHEGSQVGTVFPVSRGGKSPWVLRRASPVSLLTVSLVYFFYVIALFHTLPRSHS